MKSLFNELSAIALLAPLSGCNLSAEVLVVDNSSSDGSTQMLRDQFPTVRLIENSENVGFARANNQAIQVSEGHYVLLLNPDTEIRLGALKAMVDLMEGHPKAGATGARLLNPDGSLQVSCYPEPTLSRELWRLFHLDAVWPYAHYSMDGWRLDAPREVDIGQGACLLLRRDALEQVGLLDEDYFIYSEEVDLCYRLRQHGWLVYWIPQASVVHYGGQSTRQVAATMFLHLYQSKVLFFRKHRGWLAVRIYKLVLILAALARLSLYLLARLEDDPKRQEHLALAGHYWRLVRALAKF